MDKPNKPHITSAARRLTYQHNNCADIISGYIYEVSLTNGDIIGFVSSYASRQIEEGDDLYGQSAYLRISHGRMTQERAQRFIDNKGKGF